MFFSKLKSFSVLNFRSTRSFKQTICSSDWAHYKQVIMKPFEYIQSVPCKHVWMMGPAFNHWLQIPDETLKRIQQVNQASVTWNILLDDIADSSEFRYGVPTAHRVFGEGLTINAANKTLLLILQQIAELGDPSGPAIFIKRIEEYLDGQGVHLHWRDACICPPEEENLEMARKKCSAFFLAPVELMQLFSTNKTDFTELAINLGVYYEILDDYYNLFHPKALTRLASKIQENHTTCSDITDGKISLAIIHASQYPDVATELTDILKQRTSDPKLQNRVITLLKRHGSDEYVRDKLRELEADIRTEIDRLGGNPIMSAVMDDLSFQSYERKQEKELYC